jgi:hypothetical protein
MKPHGLDGKPAARTEDRGLAGNAAHTKDPPCERTAEGTDSSTGRDRPIRLPSPHATGFPCTRHPPPFRA